MKYRHTSAPQTGFAALEAVLLIVILAIIGGTGYYIWYSRRAADTPSTKTGTSKSTAVVPTERSYANSDYNFTFTYPGEWGKAAVYDQDINPPVRGHSYVISFGDWPKVNAFFASRDWQPADAGADPVFVPTAYDDCVVTDTSTETFLSLYRAPGACVGVRVAMIQDDTGQDVKAAFMYAEKQLNNSPSNVLTLYPHPSVLDDYSEAGLKSFADKDPFAEQFIQVVKSVKEL